MLKIGLVGEDPNDKDSFKNLFARRYPANVTFIGLLKNLRGHQLDNRRTAMALSIEYKSREPNHVVFIRDTDGVITQVDKTKKVERWFENLNIIVEKKGILFCNIYELEALILADIDTFNKMYKTSIKFKGHVSYQSEPKELLIRKTRSLQKKYTESCCPEIFANLEFDILIDRCDYFKQFVNEFELKTKLK